MFKRLLTHSTSYSFQDRVESTQKRNRYIIFFIGLFIFYTIFGHFFYRTYRVNGAGMTPTFNPYNVIVITPFGYGPEILGNYRLASFATIERGDVVLTETPGDNRINFLTKIVTPFLRLISFNFLAFNSKKEQDKLPDVVLKRVIGLPGDTLRMNNYVVYIKPKGTKYFLNEFEIAKQSYETLRPEPLKDWQAGLPLSSSFTEIVLSDQEYFVIGDNRSIANDSRTFGTIKARAIRGKVLGRYWPFGIFKNMKLFNNRGS